MRAKNIAFSGFAAAIFAATAATAAAVQVPSKQYVDNKINTVADDVQTLQRDLENNYTTSADLPDVISDELERDGGVFQTALAAKADAEAVDAALALKADAETVDAALALKADKSDLNTLATKDDLEQAVIEASNIDLSDYAKTTDVADAYATKDELADKADASDLAALGTEVGALTEALKDTVDATTVETMIDLAIPKPEGNCTAESGRCVLSIDTKASKLMWMDVTSPLTSE